MSHDRHHHMMQRGPALGSPGVRVICCIEV